MPMKIKVNSQVITSMNFMDLAHGDVFVATRTPGKFFMRVESVEDGESLSTFNALDLGQFTLTSFDEFEGVTLMDSELSISPRE